TSVDVVYDEGATDAPGGGRVANIVAPSHGPRHLQAPAFYSHYSLLQTIQRNFGVPCLQNTCNTATVKPLTPLFAVTGSAAMPFRPLREPDIAALSPTPTEPVRHTTSTPSAAGWAGHRAPALGTHEHRLRAESRGPPARPG